MSGVASSTRDGLDNRFVGQNNCKTIHGSDWIVGQITARQFTALLQWHYTECLWCSCKGCCRGNALKTFIQHTNHSVLQLVASEPCLPAQRQCHSDVYTLRVADLRNAQCISTIWKHHAS